MDAHTRLHRSTPHLPTPRLKPTTQAPKGRRAVATGKATRQASRNPWIDHNHDQNKKPPQTGAVQNSHQTNQTSSRRTRPIPTPTTIILPTTRPRKTQRLINKLTQRLNLRLRTIERTLHITNHRRMTSRRLRRRLNPRIPTSSTILQTRERYRTEPITTRLPILTLPTSPATPPAIPPMQFQSSAHRAAPSGSTKRPKTRPARTAQLTHNTAPTSAQNPQTLSNPPTLNTTSHQQPPPHPPHTTPPAPPPKNQPLLGPPSPSPPIPPSQTRLHPLPTPPPNLPFGCFFPPPTHSQETRGSVPRQVRTRFARCLYTTSSARAPVETTQGSTARTTDSCAPPNTIADKTTIPGSSTAATQELTPTIRVTRTLSTNTTSTPSPATVSTGAIPSIAPNPVATPFPPLPRRYTGYICPSTHALATQTHHHITAPPGSAPHSTTPCTTPAPSVGNTPFNISNPRHNRPTRFPSTRPTFVAPIFPDPCSRTSIPRRFPIR